MKKLFFIACFSLSIVCAFAQSFGGGGENRGGPPDGQMRQRPPRSNIASQDHLILENFPDIPNITLSQRDKIGSILTDEYKNISKQFDKKREIDIKLSREEMSQKDLERQKKNLDKIDKKITDIQIMSNKKIKKALSDEQYDIFLKKRESFKFKKTQQGPPNFNNDNKEEGRPKRPS